MCEYRKAAMEALIDAANFERIGYRKIADTYRTKAAIWFRVAANQTIKVTT